MIQFSKSGLRWGNPPKPVTWETIIYEMTPEQQDLLYMKCHKSNIQQADMVSTAIQGVLAGVFGKQSFIPSDLMDKSLGFDVDLDGGAISRDKHSHIKELTPQLRRKLRFEKWGWNDQQVIEWLMKNTIKYGKGYELWLYFTSEELLKYDICLLELPDQE